MLIFLYLNIIHYICYNIKSICIALLAVELTFWRYERCEQAFLNEFLNLILLSTFSKGEGVNVQHYDAILEFFGGNLQEN